MHGLRDGHEIPLCLGVGDGDRVARGDLLLEDRQDAPPASEDVAEADRNKPRLMMLETKDEELCHTLGHTHYVGRVDGLV